jgi:hypothetical protein
LFSIDKYMKEHHLKLGKSIKNRFKIYLDTKYWGYLCDVSLGKNIDENLIEIYNLLIKLSKEKKIICPLSSRLYHELFKQKDINRFNETARIMELLSESTIILSKLELINFELLYFLNKTIKGIVYPFKSNIFVWSKVINIVGTHSVKSFSFLSDEENEYIQKELFNEMWNTNFIYMIKKKDMSKNLKFENEKKDIINKINVDKVKFEHELKNPHYVYMSELAGILGEYKELIKNSFSNFATSETNSKEQIGNNPEDNIQPIINMIYNLFDNKKMDTYFPTFDIQAKMFSTIRWNKKQNFKVNDLDDIGHITTALPYYDYFFTEKSFSTLIKNVEYDKKYSCCVEWKAENILNILKQL